MTSCPHHLPFGDQKRFCRTRVAFRARLGVTAEDEIAALINPKPFLDDEIAAVVLAA
jgi:hypothetical protein